MFELTYQRANIIQTVTVGFFLGALVLSVGGFIVALAFLIATDQPVLTQNNVVRLISSLLSILVASVLAGIVTRLGLGLHAYWRYRRLDRHAAERLAASADENAG